MAMKTTEMKALVVPVPQALRDFVEAQMKTERMSQTDVLRCMVLGTGHSTMPPSNTMPGLTARLVLYLTSDERSALRQIAGEQERHIGLSETVRRILEQWVRDGVPVISKTPIGHSCRPCDTDVPTASACRRGRPPVADPCVHTIALKLPQSHVQAMSREARRCCCKPSDVIRRSLTQALTAGVICAPRRGPKGNLKAVAVSVPESLHTAVKAQAAMQRVSMREICEFAIYISLQS
jgi:hypothetical protein